MARRAFLLLSNPERRALFERALEGHLVNHVGTVLDAVRHCVSDPPLAVLMDLASTLHTGVAETAPLYDLGIDLPILRCTGGSPSPWIAMCQAPFKRVPLENALSEIASGDPTWKHPSNPRRFVRVNINARLMFRVKPSDPWIRANSQSMSVSGVFMQTLEPPEVGTDIDLKILDILQEEIQIKASVVWLHRWIEGPHQPGCGLNFDRSTVPDTLGHFLADSFFKKR